MSKPIFEVQEPSGKIYRIWAEGRIEGFEAGAVIINRVAPLMNYAYGLLKKAVDHGLVTDEQASRFLL